jgi:hypothetical protein
MAHLSFSLGFFVVIPNENRSFLILLQFEPSVSSRSSSGEAIANKVIVCFYLGA